MMADKITNTSNPVYEIKQKLFELLGEEKEKVYIQLLRQWVLGKITAGQFHSEALSLTTGEQVTYHNKFLIELLYHGFSGEKTAYRSINLQKSDKVNITNIINSSKRKRGSSKSESYRALIDSSDHNEFVLPTFPHPSKDINLQTIRFAADELFLPDTEMINGRFHITAWTEKLTGVDSQVAEVVIQAIQIYLKNILTAIISKYRGFKVKGGRFQYDIGGSVPNPWIRNSIVADGDFNGDNLLPPVEGNSMIPALKPTLPQMELKTMFSYGCSGDRGNDNKTNKISMENMYFALKNNSKVIGNHCIYSTFMEKIILSLRQPD